MSGSGATALAKVPGEVSPALLALLDGKTGESGATAAPYNISVLQALQDALDAPNPWVAVESIDPVDFLDVANTRMDEYHSAVLSKQARTESDFQSFMDTALAEVPDVFQDGNSIDDAVDAFETATQPAMNRNLNAYMSTMYNVNAVESSALLSGFAILKKAHQGDVNQYRATLEREKGAQKAQFILQAVQLMESAQAQLMAEKRADLAIANDVRMTHFNAAREQLNDRLEYRLKEATYELNLFPFASNVVAAAAGAPTVPLGPSKLSAAVSSGLSMAATGVGLGAQAGVQTAVIGGIAGGLLGFIGGML